MVRLSAPGPSVVRQTPAPGQPAVGRRHESCRLLMSGDDKLDLRAAQRIQDIEIFFAGNAEDIFDALAFERADQQI